MLTQIVMTSETLSNNTRKIKRTATLVDRVLIVNGFPGCGKTMLSPILSSFNSVEMHKFAPYIEQICELNFLNSIDENLAGQLVLANCDLLLYESLLGRNLNCRSTDLSSIFRSLKVSEYHRRMCGSLEESDVENEILQKKPILHLTTHMLLHSLALLNEALGKRLTFVEVIRNPLYMIVQQEKNFRMFAGPRNQHIRYIYQNEEYDFFSKGFESNYKGASSFEKAIYSITWYFELLKRESFPNLIVIPFEKFVTHPLPYLEKIMTKLNLEITSDVHVEMTRQRVPRTLLNDGPEERAYMKCGWQPPSKNTEREELNARREVVRSNTSSSAMLLMDDCCEWYERFALGEISPR